MSTVGGGFTLTALLDGTTINGYIRVDNIPLVQYYVSDTGGFTPDFESMSETSRPLLVPVLRDLQSGGILTPQTYKYYYNGVEITFDDSNLSSNTNMVGYFKLLPNNSVAIGSTSSTLPCLRVMKNLVLLGNYDNDRISFSGTVEIGGQSISFNELSTSVVIQEATGSTYSVSISYDKDVLETENDSLTLTAHVYKGQDEIMDFSNFSFKWYKVTASDSLVGEARTLPVTRSMVDDRATFRVDVYSGSEKVATGSQEIMDIADPYYVTINITGINGDVIKSGETATVTPVATKRESGTQVSGLTWTFTLKKNDGSGLILTGKNSATFTGTSCSITYNDIKNAGMGMSGYVSTTITD